jgi:3-oxoacyl-[acyl-carrier protein] reductase
MDLGLSENVAIVTASSKGLGFSIVENLLNEGCFVLMNGRDEESLEKAAGKLGESRNLRKFCGDITQKNISKALVEYAVGEFGRLDILVTNCGGPDSGGFEGVSEDQWRQAIDRSLMSHVFLIDAAIPFLKSSSAPSILTVTSFTVKKPLQNLILSNSIRAAAIGLTKSLANEYGPLGIRVNSILPGWTLTDRVDQLLEDRSKVKNSSVKQELEMITQSIPLRRMANPDEFGKVAAFLVSPAASYITGVMLSVDGGITDGLL